MNDEARMRAREAREAPVRACEAREAPVRACEAREGEGPGALALIRRPGVAAAIQRRAPDPEVTAWLAAMAPDRLPALRAAVTPAQAPRAVEAACRAAGAADGPGRGRFLADIGELAARFAALMGARRLALRLDVVRDDACRRFHVDRVTARLLCTWLGPGTQYGALPPGAGPDAAPEEVRTVPAGAPAVFRGLLWPAAGERTALLHRSPPIAGTGETRLLLVLDPEEDDRFGDGAGMGAGAG